MKRLWSVLLALCLALGAGLEVWAAPPEPCCCGQVDEPCPCMPASCPGGSSNRTPHQGAALVSSLATPARTRRLHTPEPHPLSGWVLSNGPERPAVARFRRDLPRGGPPPGPRLPLLCTFRN